MPPVVGFRFLVAVVCVGEVPGSVLVSCYLFCFFLCFVRLVVLSYLWLCVFFFAWNLWCPPGCMALGAWGVSSLCCCCAGACLVVLLVVAARLCFVCAVAP